MIDPISYFYLANPQNMTKQYFQFILVYLFSKKSFSALQISLLDALILNIASKPSLFKEATKSVVSFPPL